MLILIVLPIGHIYICDMLMYQNISIKIDSNDLEPKDIPRQIKIIHVR